MKIARSFFAAAAVLLIGASAHAQIPAGTPWTVNVPFDFTVRHTSLEAGKYTVKQFGPTVVLTSQDGRSASVITDADYSRKPSAHSSLTFRVADGGYTLIQVKTMGSVVEQNAIVAKRPSKRRDEASTAPQTVEVAALGTR